MFGMGFTEMLLIAVVAILFLGPDKLPSTMIEIAKFFKNVKGTIGSVKESLEEELHVADIKQEALAYKEELLKASESVHKVSNVQATIDAEINNILHDDEKATQVEPKKEPQEVTFKKKKKQEKKIEKDNEDV